MAFNSTYDYLDGNMLNFYKTTLMEKITKDTHMSYCDAYTPM